MKTGRPRPAQQKAVKHGDTAEEFVAHQFKVYRVVATLLGLAHGFNSPADDLLIFVDSAKHPYQSEDRGNDNESNDANE